MNIMKEKLIILISVLLFVGCSEVEVIDYEKELNHFDIREGRVFYKGKLHESGLKSTIIRVFKTSYITDSITYSYLQESFKDGLPSHSKFYKNHKRKDKGWWGNRTWGNRTYFLHQENVDNNIKNITFNFDEVFKNYFGFLFQQSKLLNKEIDFEVYFTENGNVKFDDAYINGKSLVVGKVKMEFPKGKFSLYLRPRKYGQFHGPDNYDFTQELKIYIHTYFDEHFSGVLKYDLNGPFEMYNKEGMTLLSGEFKDGKIHGKWTFNEGPNIGSKNFLLGTNVDKKRSLTPSPSKSNSGTAGVSTACRCMDALTGGSIFSPTATQIAKCRRMYICWQNAQADCMLGSSNVWTSCEMR